MKKIIMTLFCMFMVTAQLKPMDEAKDLCPEELLCQKVCSQGYKKCENQEQAKELLENVTNINYCGGRYKYSLLFYAWFANDDFLTKEFIDKSVYISQVNARNIIGSQKEFPETFKAHREKLYERANYSPYKPFKLLGTAFLMGLLTPNTERKLINWPWNSFFGFIVGSQASLIANHLEPNTISKWLVIALEETFFIAGICARYYFAQKALNKLMVHAPPALKLEKVASLMTQCKHSYPKLSSALIIGCEFVASLKLAGMRKYF